MHEEELLAVGLSINCLYPAVVLSVSISQFLEFMILFFHHFEHQALNCQLQLSIREVVGLCFLEENLN